MTDDIAGRLREAGMSPEACDGKARLFDRAAQALGSVGEGAVGPALALFVPGRIEVLGKHTDYAGGRSLLCAVERGFCLVASPRVDARVQVTDATSGERHAFDFDAGLVMRAGEWAAYPMTVARRMARNFPGARTGADIGFISDLPPAAGMSSSSALVTAAFLALAALNRLEDDESYRNAIKSREDLAGYLGTIENGQSFGSLAGDRGVGTFGGSEDHTAMLCCRAGHLSQYRFCPVRHERTIRLPDKLTFVIGVSGVVAEKTGAARDRYNRVSLAARTVLDQWRAASGRQDATLAGAAASSPDAPDRIRAVLRRSTDGAFAPSVLIDRFNQFVLESLEVIPAVGDALGAEDLDTLGLLVDRSQRAAEEWLGNQVPETVSLARSAREAGAVAASAFGAGFGGSVWALVRTDEAGEFESLWAERYHAAFPPHRQRARFFVTRPGPSAVRL